MRTPRIARAGVVAMNRSARLPATVCVGALNGRRRPARPLRAAQQLGIEARASTRKPKAGGAERGAPPGAQPWSVTSALGRVPLNPKADLIAPFINRKPGHAPLVNVPGGFEHGGLGVEHHAVEIEDDCGDHRSHGAYRSASPHAGSFIPWIDHSEVAFVTVARARASRSSDSASR